MLHCMELKFASVMEHCVTIFTGKLLAYLRIVNMQLMLLGQLKNK